jgi:hypothetical protein
VKEKLPIFLQSVDVRNGAAILMKAAGRCMQQRLAADGRHAPDGANWKAFVEKVIVSAANTLLETHQLGWVHGDVSLANLCVQLVEGEPKVTVIDWGSANKELDVSLPYCGTPIYCAAALSLAVQVSGRDEAMYKAEYDLESLVYCALELLEKRLPWSGQWKQNPAEENSKAGLESLKDSHPLLHGVLDLIRRGEDFLDELSSAITQHEDSNGNLDNDGETVRESSPDFVARGPHTPVSKRTKARCVSFSPLSAFLPLRHYSPPLSSRMVSNAAEA